jgi:hypothetical protein
VTPANAHEFFTWGAIQQGRPREYRSIDDDTGALKTLAAATAASYPMEEVELDSAALLEKRPVNDAPSPSNNGGFPRELEGISLGCGSDDSSESKCDDLSMKKQRRDCGCASRGTHRTSCYLKGFVPERPFLSDFKPKRECGCAWKGRHLSVCSLSSATTMASATLASIRGSESEVREFAFHAHSQNQPRTFFEQEAAEPIQPQPPFIRIVTENESIEDSWV